LLRGIKRRVSIVAWVALVMLAGSALLAAGAEADTPPGISPASASTTSPPLPGETLTEVPAAWTKAQTATVNQVQWEYCDSFGANCQAIPGATSPTPGSSYTVQQNYVGHTIEVSETGLGINGPIVQESRPTLVVVPPGPSIISPPTISGTPQQDQTLTASQGTWSNNPALFSYQWSECDRSGDNCNTIGGATNQSYTLTAGDVGSTIQVQVTATNAGGSGTAGSAPTSVVAPLPPSNVVPPRISGLAQPGQTLTTSGASWSNSPTFFRYQWSDCNGSGTRCHAIGGATKQSYTPSTRDVGFRIEVRESATNAGGSASAVSLPTIPVPATIKSTMNWVFFYSPTYTRILTLIVHRASVDTTIAVRCHGRGCPFTSRSAVLTKPKTCAPSTGHPCASPNPRTVNLASWFGKQRLHPPATVTVKLTRPHWIGKEYVFRTRAAHGPRVQILCVAPGAKRPRAGC